jgi:hypothetical protein
VRSDEIKPHGPDSSTNIVPKQKIGCSVISIVFALAFDRSVLQSSFFSSLIYIVLVCFSCFRPCVYERETPERGREKEDHMVLFLGM